MRELHAVHGRTIDPVTISLASPLPASAHAGGGKRFVWHADQKGTNMQSKHRLLVASVVVAAVVLLGAGGSASAADEWFVLGEQTIKAVDQGVEIKSQGGRFEKDVKQMKLSVDGADVELKKVVLH